MTGIRKVPANFSPRQNWSTNLMPDMEPYVGLITQLDGRGLPHSYARTARGYHVPIECMSHQDIQDALRAANGK